jgi:hypothetical protein
LEFVDGDEILLNWSSNHEIEIYLLSFKIPEDDSDYWSSASDADSSSSNSDCGNELDSDREREYDVGQFPLLIFTYLPPY